MTDRVEAVEMAKQALRPAHRSSIDGAEQPLEALLASLSNA